MRITENGAVTVDEETLKDQSEQKIDHIDYRVKYSDEFYKEYVENFTPSPKKKYVYRFFKRFFDIVFSLILLLSLSPLFLVIAIMVKLDSKGPVIFTQRRMGRKKKPFNCYKFRSMAITAQKDTATSLLDNPDTHFTRVGKFLRKLSFDELPQLWNVFKGDMSFIGPRPVVLTESKLIEMRDALRVYDVRPGISGYAQVNGRDDVYYKNKAIMDAYYVKNFSFMFDVKLCFQTVICVIRRDGNRENKSEK